MNGELEDLIKAYDAVLAARDLEVYEVATLRGIEPLQRPNPPNMRFS